MQKDKLSGIAGWLLVYVFLLFISLIFLIGATYPMLFGFVALNLFNKFITVLLILNIILLLNSLVLIFTYSPKAIMSNVYLLIYVIASSVLVVIISIIRFGDVESILYLAGPIILGGLWINYWLKSKRVEKTFLSKKK
jgi:hypothetical protein